MELSFPRVVCHRQFVKKQGGARLIVPGTLSSQTTGAGDEGQALWAKTKVEECG